MFMKNKQQKPCGARFEALCIEKNLKWADIARDVGASPQVINGWRFRGVSRSHALKMAAKLGCKPSEISDIFDTPTALMGSNVEEMTVNSGVDVPIVSWVQAGNWNESPVNPTEAEDWVVTSDVTSPRAFALRVKGDSMVNPYGYPSISEGVIIVVDPDAQAESGSLVVARIEGSSDAVFKKLVIDGGQKYLKPLNPQYPVIPINGDCVIVGVVKNAILKF